MPFRIKHIRYRITMSVSFIIILTILMATLMISNIYTKELMKNTVVITKQKMNIITQELEKELNLIIELQNTIQDDDDLQSLIVARNNAPQKLREYDRKISEILRQYAYGMISVNSIFIFDRDRSIMDPLYKIAPYDEIIRHFEPFTLFIDEKQYSEFSEPTDFPSPSYKKAQQSKNTITYFAHYVNENTFVQIGYLLININRDYIFRKFIRSCEDEFDFVIVADKSGKVIQKIGDISYEEEIISETIFGENITKQNVLIKDMNTFMITQTLENNKDWVVIGGISYDALNKGNKMIRNIVILIIGMSILLVIFISMIISERITKPIITIADSMKTLESNRWPEPIKVTSHDELKILVEGYNKMIIDVKSLVQQVKSEQSEKMAFELKNLKLRLELLQSQINPHFIHNTLNGIKYLAMENKSDQLIEVIESFNLLLRASMSINRDFITVLQEIECVRSFINIFQMRYDYEVDIKIHIDPTLESRIIPKLILQPLVENSLYHGILAKGEEGVITVVVIPSGTNMFIKVKDNGVGVNLDTIVKVLSQDVDQAIKVTNKGFNNVGLRNINDRLKLYYGEEHQLQIESIEGEGTTVSFTIPIREA